MNLSESNELRALRLVASLVSKTMPELSMAQRLRVQNRLYGEWRRIWLSKQQ